MMKILETTLMLGVMVLALSNCTTTAESQLKESVCKNCLGEDEFYRNGQRLDQED